MLKLIGKIFGINKDGGGMLKNVADVVDRWVDTKEDKREFFKELYQMEASEKANARAMYGADNVMQKVYALTFLLAYLSLTAWLIYATINSLPKRKFIINISISQIRGRINKVGIVSRSGYWR